MTTTDEAYLRIGELSRRTGVTPELLRAWELRYELLEPSRSAGGFRLYSDVDEARVRRMTELMRQGLSAAEAARRAKAAPAGAPIATPAPRADAASSEVDEVRAALRAALDAMDAAAADAAFDRAMATLSVDAVLAQVVLPYLRELGDRWVAGEASIAQEHFASNLLRGRLLGIARGWADGPGPTVLLACPSGETHDLGLVVFGIEMARHGWRVRYIGADTPLETIEEVVRDERPDLVVLVVLDRRRARGHAAAIRSLATLAPVAVGGAVTERDAEAFGARVLTGDPVEAALALARM